MIIQCRVTAQNFCPIRLNEGQPGTLPTESSLNQPEENGRVVARCMNCTEPYLTFKAGSTIGTFTGVEVDQVEAHQLRAESSELEVYEDSCNTREVPRHLQPSYDTAKGSCQGPTESQKLAALLSRYSAVSSTGREDIGHTTLAEHSISLKERIRPVCMFLHRLGLEKEAGAERQVNNLLKNGLIEPANGAWGSPVVLVDDPIRCLCFPMG